MDRRNGLEFPDLIATVTSATMIVVKRTIRVNYTYIIQSSMNDVGEGTHLMQALLIRLSYKSRKGPADTYLHQWLAE